MQIHLNEYILQGELPNNDLLKLSNSSNSKFHWLPRSWQSFQFESYYK